MKSGKGNGHNRSGTVGGSKGKGKRKKVVNTNNSNSTSSYNKAGRYDRDDVSSNGHSNNNSKTNGDDSKSINNYLHKSSGMSKKSYNDDD